MSHMFSYINSLEILTISVYNLAVCWGFSMKKLGSSSDILLFDLSHNRKQNCLSLPGTKQIIVRLYAHPILPIFRPFISHLLLLVL